MARNVIAIIVALIGAYVAWKVISWIVGAVFSVFFGTLSLIATLIPVLIVAVPIYFLVRRKLLR